MDDQEAMALMQREKEIYSTASERKGGPRPSDLPTRAELLKEFSGTSERVESTGSIIIGHVYPPCTKPLADLEPILLKDLRLETVHHDKLLVLRTFGIPKFADGALNAAEDTNGDVDRLTVHHCAGKVLPRDQLVAIKEPYYKITADGGSAIRVDHPSNLVVLDEDNGFVPAELRRADFDSLSIDLARTNKEKGNAVFREKDYLQAIQYYSRALKTCEGESETMGHDLHRNRAMANLYLGRYENALADARAAVVPGMAIGSKQLSGKAYYRAGLAAYRLERYAAAASYFENLLELTPNDLDAQRELKRTNERLNEQASGVYDLETITHRFRLNPQHLPDHASFTSNVEVLDTESKGRGLFATNNIKAGELVMCEKAFCVAGIEDNGDELSMIINLKENTMSIGTHSVRLVKVIEKLLHNPKQAVRFLDLYDGNYSPKPDHTPVDGVVPVDVFQVQKALELNGFGCSSIASTVSAEGDDGHSPTGVWIVSSAINHDCVGNVCRSFVGDLLLLRASKDIMAGEEITMRYKNPENSTDEFHAILQKTWKFTCACALCQVELTVPGYQRNIRASLVEQASNLLEAHSVTEENVPTLELIKQVETLRNRIQETYSEALFKKMPRSMLPDLDLWLCMAYATQGMGDAVLDMAQQVFRDIGLCHLGDIQFDRSNARFDVVAIHAAMYATQIESMKGRESSAEKYRALGRDVYQLLCGTMYGFEEGSGSA